LKGRDVYISGIGSFLPGEPVPFDQIETVLGPITNGSSRVMKRIEKIRPVMKGLLGIEYSHYALDPTTRESTETNVSMTTKSALKALESAQMKASDIDFLVYAGILYDYFCPPSSVLVQDALNIPYCAEMSIHSNCTAIYKAIQVAVDAIAIGRYENVLIVTSQLSSAILRSEYFNQQALTEEQAILRWFLSDGAGALILTSDRAHAKFRINHTYLESVGTGIAPTMRMEVGAIRWNHQEVYKNGWHHLVQDLSTVMKLAPELGENGLDRMMKKTGIDVESVKCFFCNVPTMHLMNLVIQKTRKKWNNPNLQFYSKIATRGYPGAPAIIIALDEYINDSQLASGDVIVSFVTESSKWMHAGFVLECI
jgi:3-oxoacyl-[acyl-carrier-protein] synthase III